MPGRKADHLLSSLLDSALRTLEVVAALCLGLISFLVVYQVVARYAFASPPSWTEELARYLQVWLVMLASPVCLARGMHLAVDYITPKLDPWPRHCVRAVVAALVGVFSALLTGYGVSLLGVAAIQVSPALGISMVWPYLAVPVSGLLMTLVSVRIVAREIVELSDHRRGGGVTSAHSTTNNVGS